MAALPDSSLVSLEEYLSTSYDPDVEFVDGVLVERNVGDWLHSGAEQQARLVVEVPSESDVMSAVNAKAEGVCQSGRAEHLAD
jgi:hypothetical protein